MTFEMDSFNCLYKKLQKGTNPIGANLQSMWIVQYGQNKERDCDQKPKFYPLPFLVEFGSTKIKNKMRKGHIF